MKSTNVLFFCLSFILFTACEKDDKIHTLYQTLTITELSRASDDPTEVTHTEQFYYKSKRILHTLLSYKNIQTYNGNTISNNTSITYDDLKFMVTTHDESGNVYTYRRDSFRVTQCDFTEPGTDNTRTYYFSYNEEGYLIQLIERINDVENREITLDYDNGSLTSIKTTTFDDGIADTSIRHFQTGQQINTDKLPFLPLTEEYPFYFHKVMFYAGLMGKSLKYLPESSSYEGNADETVYYTYTTNPANRIDTCRINTVSYGKSYKRTIAYSY